MMGGVCLSVVCLDLIRERKGPTAGSPKLAGWEPIARVTVNLFGDQKIKGQCNQPINAIADNAAYTGREHYNFLKIAKL